MPKVKSEKSHRIHNEVQKQGKPFEQSLFNEKLKIVTENRFI